MTNNPELRSYLDLPKQVVYVECVAETKSEGGEEALLWAASEALGGSCLTGQESLTRGYRTRRGVLGL
ncbi:hypothetical protein [Streptomyces sp. NPDC049906]|uniref:hypothetical protein n=1 Tax=Streptomyces sp. NPDC049906 TaxID=3155656 RepID=UPI0034399FAB